MRWILVVIFLLACYSGFGGETFQQRRTEQRDNLEKTLATVNAEDGIDAREALIIVESYWFEYGEYGAEGGYRQPKEHQAYWQFPVWRGIAPGQTEPIIIDKKTGKVSWGRLGPTIANPKTIFEKQKKTDWTPARDKRWSSLTNQCRIRS